METIAELEVQEILWTKRSFVCKRAKTATEQLHSFLNDSYKLIYQTLQDQGLEAEYPPFSIHYSRDESRGLIELAAAVPVKDHLRDLDGFEILTIPESKALVINHFGDYDSINSAYNILEKHMLERGYKRSWLLEQYFTDTSIVKDPAKWKTSVYFLLR